jgi:glyoxylase-like metal-dependent hydrolase (beta-lactamase superfamily II)
LLDERDLRLRWVLRTHSHGSEDDGAAALGRRTGATCAGGSSRQRPLADGDALAFGAELLRVIACPGHTPDSVCFQWRDRLFTGDALEPVGGEAAATPAADPALLYDSVTRRLFVLPAETLVFPGRALHGRRVSTIGEERVQNPDFGGRSRDAFIAAFRRRGAAALT